MLCPAGRLRSAGLPLATLVGVLFASVEVGPSQAPSPSFSDWVRASVHAVPFSPKAAALVNAVRQCRPLSAHLRGGADRLGATTPLCTTPGFDARQDDETEELMVNSPGNAVLPLARAQVNSPGNAVLPPSRAQSVRRVTGERSHRVNDRVGASLPRVLARADGCQSKSGPPNPGLAASHVASAPPHSMLGRPETPAPTRSSAPCDPLQSLKSIEERISAADVALSDRTSDWGQRVRALKDVLDIVNALSDTPSATASGTDSRASVLSRLLPGLCTQLQDKRSTVVKQVCNTLKGVASLLGVEFEAAAVKLIPALLSLTFVTVRVISDSAVECLHVIAEHTRASVLLPEIAKGLTDAHVPLRQCAASLLTLLLTQRDAEELNAHKMMIVDLTVTTLNDPAVGVRNKGKQSFTSLVELFTTDAHRMLLRVSSAMRSQLSKQLKTSLQSSSREGSGVGVRAGSMWEMLAGNEPTRARTRFEEFRALHRQQSLTLPDSAEDIVVMSPVQDSLGGASVVSHAPPDRLVESTCQAEPHASGTGILSGPRVCATFQRVRIPFEQNLGTTSPVDEQESVSSGKGKLCENVPDRGMHVSSTEAEAENFQNATLFNAEIADDSSSSQRQYGLSSISSNRLALRAEADGGGPEDARRKHQDLPRGSVVAGPAEPSVAVNVAESKRGPRRPVQGRVVHDGRVWKEVSVGQVAHAAAPHKAFVSVGGRARNQPVRLPLTMRGSSRPGSVSHRAVKQNALVAGGRRAAIMRPDPEVSNLGHNVWGAGVHRPSRRAKGATRGAQGMLVCGGGGSGLSGVGLERLFQDCDAFLRHRNLSAVSNAGADSDAVTGPGAPPEAPAEACRLEDKAAKTSPIAQDCGEVSRVREECDRLKKELEAAHVHAQEVSRAATVSQSLTGMLWMTMRFADSLSGVGKREEGGDKKAASTRASKPRTASLANSCSAQLALRPTQQLSETSAPDRAQQGAGQVQSSARCFKCAKEGHVSSQCPAVGLLAKKATVNPRRPTFPTKFNSCATQDIHFPADSEGAAARVNSEPTHPVIPQSGAIEVSSTFSDSSGQISQGSSTSCSMSSTQSAESQVAEQEETSSTEMGAKRSRKTLGSVSEILHDSPAGLRADVPVTNKLDVSATHSTLPSESVKEVERKQEEDEGEDNEYEAQRQARIRGNLDTMAQLGIQAKPAPLPPSRARASVPRRHPRAESIGSEDSSQSEWQRESADESSEWEKTARSTSSQEEQDFESREGRRGRRARGSTEEARIAERASRGMREYLVPRRQGKHVAPGAEATRPSLKISLKAPQASCGHGVPAAGTQRKARLRLKSLEIHPSQVDPQQTGLTRIEQFRAEMVCAVYESEGTSAAEELMGSSLPSIVHHAFAEVGWGADHATTEPEGEDVSACSPGVSDKIVANAAFTDREFEDSEMHGVSELEASVTPSREGYRADGVTDRAPAASAASSVSPSSSSSSSLHKRLLSCTVNEPGKSEGEEVGKEASGRGNERKRGKTKSRVSDVRAPQGRKSSSAPAPLEPGEWCRRDGVKGKYYHIKNKYVCSNCGLTGHVKSTCSRPLGSMDTSLEAQGWQVMKLSSRAFLFVSLCRSPGVTYPCLFWLVYPCWRVCMCSVPDKVAQNCLP